MKRKFNCVSFFNTGADLAAEDASRIGAALEKAHLGIRWQSMARADSGWTEPICRTLKKQGFEYVMFGIESLSDPVLALMGKGISAREQIEALAAACKGGLKPAVSLIFDFPGETIDDLDITLNAIEPYVKYISAITLLRFHLDRTSIMAANETKYSIETKNRMFRSVNRDDIFEIRYQDHHREQHHLSRALDLFGQWIYSLNQKHSMLFTVDAESVQLGFDLNFFFEGCCPDFEKKKGFFSLDTILNRRYRLNRRLIRSTPEENGHGATYYLKHRVEGFAAETAQAQLIYNLESGIHVAGALLKTGISPQKDLGVFLSSIQLINGLDLLQVLLPLETT